MLPNDDKPWAKGVARTVICLTIVALACLAYFLQIRGMLHISEIVPPNLAVLYPWLLTGKPPADTRATKSTMR